MKNKLLILIAVFLVGCNQSPEAAKKDTARVVSLAQEMAEEIVYVKDVRTGLCFATAFAQRQAGVMATVPCTPEVEALIGNMK